MTDFRLSLRNVAAIAAFLIGFTVNTVLAQTNSFTDLTATYAQEQPIMDKPKVDKRVELLSIIVRFAGFEINNYQSYTNKIDEYFNPYRDHELILFTKEVLFEKGIIFDVMGVAIYIDENINPLVEPDKIPYLKQWKKEDADKFVELLKKFYHDTKCEIFFNNNENLYAEASKRFLPIYEALDLTWYSSFYGKEPEEDFIIINAMALGGANYGPSLDIPNQKRKVYAILGTRRVDSLDIEMPIFIKEEYLPTIIHEFNHSFCNDLIIKNEEAFKNSGEKIFEKVKTEMAPQGYNNWLTVSYEALVRAAVIKYMKDHNFTKDEIEAEINSQIARKFLWITELVAELDNYSKNRNQYPTLESYMPNIIEAQKIWAEKIQIAPLSNE